MHDHPQLLILVAALRQEGLLHREDAGEEQADQQVGDVVVRRLVDADPVEHDERDHECRQQRQQVPHVVGAREAPQRSQHGPGAAQARAKVVDGDEQDQAGHGRGGVADGRGDEQSVGARARATATAAPILTMPPIPPSTSALNLACRNPMKIESVIRLSGPKMPPRMTTPAAIAGSWTTNVESGTPRRTAR